MSKGKPNNIYTGEFKQKVIEIMRSENLSYHETTRMFEISDRGIIRGWERIYLEEGVQRRVFMPSH